MAVHPAIYPPSPSPVRPSSDDTRSLVVEFRSGESVQQHPALKELIQDGWHIESAVPECIDPDCTQLRVKLVLRPDGAARA